MLSIESPQISPLKSSSSCCSDHHEITSPHKVDLPNSNFSIRDYVFAMRSKDIAKNWPFSLKSLQLCFKHGMKDVLPPFDSVKNKPIARCASETVSPHKQIATHVDVEPRSLEVLRVADSTVGLTEKLPNSSRPGFGDGFSSKKCKLIVKFGDRTSTEDIASNCTTVSESMASKVCPVCRTFSSSSNTTLNAHIDQCLSMESSPKWATDSKLTRNRIKPSRTRFMVDIYVDAKRCTLEELDIRNGRILASVGNAITEKVQIHAEGIKQRVPQVHPEDSGDVGPVYIDASGRKLRILSKFNDEDRPLLKVGENLGPKKALKGSKLCKLFSAKKKKCHQALRKRHKYIKLAAQSKKKLDSRKMRTSQVSGPNKSRLREEASVQEEGHQIPKPYKPSDPGTFKEWKCSKRTGVAKKTINQDSRHSCKWHASRDLLVDSNQDSVVGRTTVQKFTNLSENVLSSPQKSKKRISKPIYDARFGGKKKSSLLETGITDNIDRDFHPLKRKFIELNEDSPPMLGNCTFRSSSSSPSEEAVLTGLLNDDSDVPPTFSRKSFMNRHATTPKISELSSMNKVLALRNTDCLVNTETDEELEGYDSESTENDETSLDCGDDDQIFLEKRKATNFSTIDESYSLDEEESTDFSAGGSEYVVEQVNGAQSFEGSVMSWKKSMDAKFPELTIQTKNKSNSLHSIEEAMIGPTYPSFIDAEGEGTFCNREVGNVVFGKDNFLGDVQGNFFTQVDPIPIPGPPGSFLPSPRGMGSDDFPGNSTLTTSRVPSSQDHQHDLVDGDSSTSPISATSSISNHNAFCADLKFPEPLSSVGPLDNISCEKRPLGFRNDDQPCCCQRKERVPHGVGLNYQESQLLKRRAVDYKNPNARLGNLDIRPGNFVAEKDFLPVMKSSARFDHSDLASPSVSTPVLRLMGKNLMVINKDDESSVPPRQAPPCAPFPTLLGHLTGQSFFASSANNCQDNTHLQARVPAGIFLDQPMNGSFRDPHKYKTDCIMLSRHDRSSIINRPNAASAYDQQQRTGIYDMPKSEANCGSGISIPTICSYNERGPTNPFVHFWPQEPVPGTSHHHETVFRQVGKSPTVRWNRTPEGFVLLQQGPFTAPAVGPQSSTTHQGSQMYYSPSFQ